MHCKQLSSSAKETKTHNNKQSRLQSHKQLLSQLKNRNNKPSLLLSLQVVNH